MVIPKGFEEEVTDLLKEYNVIELLDFEMEHELMLFKILITTEESESILDLLEKHFSHLNSFRIYIIPVQASIPRIEENIQKEGSGDNGKTDKKARISREELYEMSWLLAKPIKFIL
jgi:hypothetical protein